MQPALLVECACVELFNVELLFNKLLSSLLRLLSLLFDFVFVFNRLLSKLLRLFGDGEVLLCRRDAEFRLLCRSRLSRLSAPTMLLLPTDAVQIGTSS